MRKATVLCVILTLCFACVAFAADFPNLVGTWDGKSIVHHRIHGFQHQWHEQETVSMVVEKQEGRLFSGFFQRIKKGGSVHKHDFSGIIMKGNKQALITWHDLDGITLMDIEASDRLTNYGAIHAAKHAFVTMTEYTRAK